MRTMNITMDNIIQHTMHTNVMSKICKLRMLDFEILQRILQIAQIDK